MKKYTITYDFGTGSVKCAVIDEAYRCVGASNEAYPMYSVAPGFAEQKVSDYLDAMRKVTRRLLEQLDLTGESIQAIVISQTSSTLIFADENKEALCDCVTWVDSRAGKQAEELNRLVGVEGWATGKRVSAKIKWFIENRPEIVKQAKYLVDVSGYMYLKLTGETAFDITAAYATGLVYPIGKQWSEWAVKAVGIEPALLSDRIIDSCDTVGHTNGEFARSVGFKDGTPVFGGCSDNANGNLAAACIHPGDAQIYMGSSGWISVTSPLSGERSGALQMPSAVPGMGYEYFCTNSVGTSMDYLIREFYKEEAGSPNIYSIIEEDVRAAGNTPKDVIFMPFLYGEECPVDDAYVRGGLFNIDATVTRAHIARAVMEGIAFNFRWIKEQMEQMGLWNVNWIRVLGGGAQSDTHLQIIADVIGEKIKRVANPRFAGNIGLAVCADIGLGKQKSFDILDSYVKDDKEFYPQAEFKERYDRLFQAYKNIYSGLKDVYQSLNKID